MSLSEAKKHIEIPYVHDLGDTSIAYREREREERMKSVDVFKDSSVHHTSAFLSTSPVTQD